MNKDLRQEKVTDNKSLQPTTHPGPRLAPLTIDEASRGPWRAAAELNRYVWRHALKTAQKNAD